MTLDVVETLSDLVRIPSVNPMGRAVSGEIYYEHRVTDYLEKLFKRLKIPTERHTVAPQRDNLIARVDGFKTPDKGGKILMLEAHQDTVPVEGMTIDPFDPQVRDGKIFGRGSCDIKGGMAAMISALARLAKEKPRGRPTVVLACTVNEEHGFTGATDWARCYAGAAGETPAPRSKLLPRVPDGCIVAEPTKLNVVVAHKGAVRWRCHTGGIATHSSQPHLGDNAVYHMARVLQVLESYAKEVVSHLSDHPLCGHPTLSVGLISGGISVNTVPDRCTIEIDRRVLPGEDPEVAYRHAIDYLSTVVPVGTPVIHDKPFLMTYGLADDNNQAFGDQLGGAIRERVPDAGQLIGVPFGTNAPHYARTGCPTVVFGPGSIDQAHTADEWLEVEQLQSASEILFDFAREFAG
jgi:acetylornithine deacetylase/succinyl-diaminopimelate desuccinylase-like protein